jgi:integrase
VVGGQFGRSPKRGPTLHEFSLAWLDRYAGTGHDSVRANTRRESCRLLANLALSYFGREVRVRDLDRSAVQQFVDWLTTCPGRDGRAWSMRERRYLSRAELVRLLNEVPPKWRPLFELLAATGLRISEAVGLRWSDLVLDGDTPHLQVRRAIVEGAIVAPKSRHGARLISLTPELAATLRAYRPDGAADDAFVFAGRDGAASDQGSLRRRVLVVCRRASRADRRRLSHAASHVRLDAHRVRTQPAASAALDGPPLTGVHPRDLRAPHRRRSRAGARTPPRAAIARAKVHAAQLAGQMSAFCHAGRRDSLDTSPAFAPTARAATTLER